MSLLCKGLPSASIITAKVACRKVDGAVVLERPRDGDDDVVAAVGVMVVMAVAAVVVRGREAIRKAENPRIITILSYRRVLGCVVCDCCLVIVCVF